MALSRPLYSVLGLYLEQLHSHALRTRSVSSCIAAVLGNLTSQKLLGAKDINYNSVTAFGIYGLLIGGSLPNLFYQLLRYIISSEEFKKRSTQLFVDRFLYTPLYVGVCLYVLPKLEGHNSNQALQVLMKNYWPALRVNWIWLTALHYAILKYVPSIVHAPCFNIVEYLWFIFLALRLKQKSEKKK